MPNQVHGSRTLELLWTIVPAIVVAMIFGFTVDTMSNMTASGSLSNPVAHVHAVNDKEAWQRVARAQPVDLVINVLARQWVWQFNYSGGDNVSASGQLIVPANRNIRLDMTSADVVHAWWVPELGPMLYVNPGEASHVWFNAPAGEYLGQCNVFCGAAHATMLSKVTVLPEAEYDEWYAKQAAANTAPVAEGNVEAGKNFFMNGPCIACHFIEGTKAQGKVAPRPLTVFATYPTIGQVDGFTNNAENVRKWLTNPQAIKPGTQMPNLNLKPQDMANLAVYLETLK
jgi:cytochrome c oxidase subunit 2